MSGLPHKILGLHHKFSGLSLKILGLLLKLSGLPHKLSITRQLAIDSPIRLQWMMSGTCSVNSFYSIATSFIVALVSDNSESLQTSEFQQLTCLFCFMWITNFL